MALNRMSQLGQEITCLWLRLQVLTGDIMQAGSPPPPPPLSALSITAQLQKRFAYLPGGRSTNGNPLIVFPEFPAFSELEEEELQTVLQYLTSVPRASGVGFLVLLDRRLDRWAAVKNALNRIAGLLPGGAVDLVLVLRPSSLLQRTLSDFLFKVNRDDFKMKVVMLSSVTELHAYMDPAQLTTELGGAREYDHQTWISHRTALEAFALMVRTTAQTLQAFGTQLAETELPNDAVATATLLEAHREEKDRMKSLLQVSLHQGASLLLLLQEPRRGDAEHLLLLPPTAEESDGLDTVHRLLDQLDQTERAFDDFWERHHSKLEQCLQLRLFEASFREVRAQLDVLCDRVSAFSEVSISPAHADHVLRELIGHEEKACEVLDRARSLAADGDALIAADHYGDDSIRPKGEELRAAAGGVASTLRRKRSVLLRARGLHVAMETALRWCEGGVFLLAGQAVDRVQSQEGARAALGEVERYLDSAPQHLLGEPAAVCAQYEGVVTALLREEVQRVHQKQESVQEMFERRRVSLKKLAARQPRPVQTVAPRPEVKTPPPSPDLRHKERRSEDTTLSGLKASPPLPGGGGGGGGGTRHASLSEEEENLAIRRSHVMNELLETERVYVDELLCVLEGYAAQMENPAMAHLLPSGLLHKKEVLFGNMPQIYSFHKRTFLKELEAYTDCPELVGRCFLERMGELRLYEAYCQNKPRSEVLWRRWSDCAFFQECQRRLEHKLGLDSYLLKPVQRITKYQLLLKELLKVSPGGSCGGGEDLQEALSSVLGILKDVNDSMHLIAITGYQGDLSSLGRLLLQGSFSVWTEHKRGHAKVKDLARFKPMQRHLFLHPRALLLCKRREEGGGEGGERAPSYSYKHSLDMSVVGITENAKGDHKKFEIWCNSREEVFIVQAPSLEIKTLWVNEIRKVLTEQLKACRDASQQKTSDSPSPTSSSPFRSCNPKSQKKPEEKKAEPITTPDPASPSSSSSPKPRDEVMSPGSSSGCRKRFSLQGFGKTNKGAPASPDRTRSQSLKSEASPFAFRGWAKASLSVDASEEQQEEEEDYSSGEEPVTSDPEDEGGKKQSPGTYTVTADCDRTGPQELSVKGGELVQLIREGEAGQWYVKDQRTAREGWVSSANLQALPPQSQSSQSLTSSDGSVSGNLSTSTSTSTSYSDSYTSYSDIRP